MKSIWSYDFDFMNGGSALWKVHLKIYKDCWDCLSG